MNTIDTIHSFGENTRKYGTFRDCLRSPIHRWFTYPAGYSHRFVEAKIGEYNVPAGGCIGDPFLGVGTTSLTAKLNDVNSIGVEAHEFVHEVATTKINYEYNIDDLQFHAEELQNQAQERHASGTMANKWPSLVHKCFSSDNLAKLDALRTGVELSLPFYRSFFKLALTATLRDATTAGAGWPYIAPSKFAERTVQKDAFHEFARRCALMMDDIKTVDNMFLSKSRHKIHLGDARSFSKYARRGSLDMAITSPPYLNNYDYADRTRLETYFWGTYGNWKDITVNVRDKLIIAATTQIVRGKMNSDALLTKLSTTSPSVYRTILDASNRLHDLRNEKSGRKSYDLMVAGYFSDMLKVVEQVYKSLKKNAPFILVLGDSAPYGIHIATDVLVAVMGLDIGFREANIEVIRKRGDKWKKNPQRHSVALRESIVTLIK